jgi:hypothetical protein
LHILFFLSFFVKHCIIISPHQTLCLLRLFSQSPFVPLGYSTGKPIAPPPAEATRAARFLRETPGLNKVVLGDFLGRGDHPNVDVLAAMVALFDFGRLTVDEALRVFLEAFRLPGEAQQVPDVQSGYGAGRVPQLHGRLQESFGKRGIVPMLARARPGVTFPELADVRKVRV